jgi:hypothetical protein
MTRPVSALVFVVCICLLGIAVCVLAVGTDRRLDDLEAPQKDSTALYVALHP